MTIDNEISQQAAELFRVGHSTRPRNQYASIAQVCKDRNIVAAVGVVKDDDHRNWSNVKIVNKNTSDACIDSDKKMNPYRIFSKFRFPTLYVTKKEMMRIAEKEGFSDILSLSWSCWFPQNGKPCGQCNMCKTRII
jgi:7-cyano-7-deazaguanine synthase in queuosine biosynthesis